MKDRNKTIQTVIGERLLYLPSFGFCVGVVIVARRFRGRNLKSAVFVCLVAWMCAR